MNVKKLGVMLVKSGKINNFITDSLIGKTLDFESSNIGSIPVL